MKKQFILATCFILVMGFLKAQTVSVSPDKNKISFVITEKTTKAEIGKAMAVFSENSIAADIKASWKGGNIHKLKIDVDCSKGRTKYNTDSPDVLKKGVTILVDKSKDAKVALGVGPNVM